MEDGFQKQRNKLFSAVFLLLLELLLLPPSLLLLQNIEA